MKDYSKLFMGDTLLVAAKRKPKPTDNRTAKVKLGDFLYMVAAFVGFFGGFAGIVLSILLAVVYNSWWALAIGPSILLLLFSNDMVDRIAAFYTKKVVGC